jgi:hypothetical protein
MYVSFVHVDSQIRGAVDFGAHSSRAASHANAQTLPYLV